MILHARAPGLRSRTALPAEDAGAQDLAPTVVVADVDPHLRDIYRTLLVFHGYRVVEARDGVEALRLIRAHRPDAALLDLHLAGLDGLEATRLLRREPASPPTSVILLSVYPEARVRLRARRAGCSGFVAKPFAPGDLVAELRRVLAPPAGPA